MNKSQKALITILGKDLYIQTQQQTNDVDIEYQAEQEAMMLAYESGKECF
jgi:hypothetical protein